MDLPAAARWAAVFTLRVARTMSNHRAGTCTIWPCRIIVLANSVLQYFHTTVWIRGYQEQQCCTEARQDGWERMKQSKLITFLSTRPYNRDLDCGNILDKD